jgi:beta-glucanase (GH16 family)
MSFQIFREAVDLHYWVTGDLEWYTPDAVTTAGGNLVITMQQQNSHNLNYTSGMLQSWNKLCFTGGIIEGKLRTFHELQLSPIICYTILTCCSTY